MEVDEILESVRTQDGLGPFIDERLDVARESVRIFIESSPDRPPDEVANYTHHLFFLLWQARAKKKLKQPLDLGAHTITAEDVSADIEQAAKKIREAAELLRFGRKNRAYHDRKLISDQIQANVPWVQTACRDGFLPGLLDELARALLDADPEIAGNLFLFNLHSTYFPIELRGTRGAAQASKEKGDRGHLVRAIAQFLPRNPALIARLANSIGYNFSTDQVVNILKGGKT